jgi:hypothetical protein
LATLREFAEALRPVAEDVDHDTNLHRMFVVATDDEVKAAWTSAIQFFKVNERLLNEIRNETMTPEQRSQRARKAVPAREAKRGTETK